MIDIDSVIKEVAKITGYDKDTVAKVCKFPFVFTEDVMKDKDDTHDILFAKLFKFKLKKRYKENKNLKYTSK